MPAAQQYGSGEHDVPLAQQPVMGQRSSLAEHVIQLPTAVQTPLGQQVYPAGQLDPGQVPPPTGTA